MLEVHEVTKRYGDTLAVDALSFTVSPGRVTGFLGPNGAGKSTTLRLLLGLDRPDAGTALVDGSRSGLAVGTITRSTASTVVALTFVLFLLPVLVGLVPPLEPVLAWLPSQAGQAVLQPAGTPGYLDPWAGLALLGGYTSVIVLAARYALDVRDA